MPLQHPEARRLDFSQVEQGYSENQARREAYRCLRCDVCARCGKCVEACRLQLGESALHFGFCEEASSNLTDFTSTEQRCIGCGACAAVCPSGALSLIDQNGERLLSLCSAVLARHELVYCERCGLPLAARKYLEYLKDRADQQRCPTGTDVHLCPSCQQIHAAEHYGAIHTTVTQDLRLVISRPQNAVIGENR